MPTTSVPTSASPTVAETHQPITAQPSNPPTSEPTMEPTLEPTDIRIDDNDDDDDSNNDGGNDGDQNVDPFGEKRNNSGWVMPTIIVIACVVGLLLIIGIIYLGNRCYKAKKLGNIEKRISIQMMESPDSGSTSEVITFQNTLDLK